MDMAIEQQRDPASESVWKRGLLMLVFLIAFSIAHAILNLAVIVQFLWLLFSGESNRFLASFGRSLSAWLADATRFLTYACDEMPFPWKRWPYSG
jgi:hypothetical protein